MSFCPKPLSPQKPKNFTLHQMNGYWHWYSSGPVFDDNYCSEDGFDTQAEAIADAADFLTSVYNSRPEDNDFNELEDPATSIDIDLADASPYQSGVHFALYEYDDNPGVRWQGLCQEPNETSQWWNTDADFAHLVSDRGYFNAHYAAADCIFSLHTERGYSIEEAITLVYELALPVHVVIEENQAEVTAYIEQVKAAEYAERCEQDYGQQTSRLSNRLSRYCRYQSATKPATRWPSVRRRCPNSTGQAKRKPMETTTAPPALPMLPSAKPPKSLAALFLGLSVTGLLIGLGLGSSAIALYAQDARTRLAQNDRLERIERNAEVRQKNAQLKRDYSAPLWVTDQTYGPGVTYEVSGVRRVEVPVLLGPQLDTAVCIGSMGPEGFVQNVNSPFCVGY